MATRAVLLALLASMTALAGCLSDEEEDAGGDGEEPEPILLPPGTYLHRPGGLAEDPANLTGTDDALLALLRDAQGASRYTGFQAFEPTIGSDREGGLFLAQLSPYAVVAEVPETSGPRRATHIARSLDQGDSWDDVTPRLPTGHPDPPQTNDPFLHVDVETGRIFTIDLEGTVCDYMLWSDDHGETWEKNPVACGLPPGGHDHQSITTATPRAKTTSGYENLVYYCVNRPGVDSACATSTDGGATWGALVSAFSVARDGCGGLHGHVEAAPDGTAYVPKGDCNGKVAVAVSEDDGETWRVRTVSETEGADHELRVAVDEAGNVYGFWQGQDGLPYLSHSTDRGETWTEPLMIGHPNLTGMDFPAIAAGAGGRVVLAYAGTDFPDPYATENPDPVSQTQQPRNIEGMNWSAHLTVVLDALAPSPLLLTVTAHDPADPIVRGECGRIRCPGIGDFIDATIDRDGRAWAAFVDVCNDACAGPDGRTNAGGIRGFAAAFAQGPALRGDLRSLPPLPNS